LRYQIGIFSGGCEIFRFIPKDSSTEFAAEDMDTIFGMPEALNQAIKLFCSGGIFKERNDIWRFSVPRGSYDKVKTEFSDDGERKRLTVQVPLDASLSLVEAIEVLAKAFEKTDLSYLYASTENEQIRSAIREAEKNINKEKEAVLAAIRETWEYKKTLYAKMVKPRQIDEVTSKWLEQNAPNLKDRVIVSWQLEMGFHPELSLALLEVMQKEVDKGGISIQDADILLKKISMSTMAGGLGALMPDLVRGIADNGASVVALNMIYDRHEDGTEAGKWLKEALKNLSGYQHIDDIALIHDGNERTVSIDICKLGGALQVWIYGLDELYKGDQNSQERASQMKFYNAAGQAVIKELRKRWLIAQEKKLIHLENEAYTHHPKEEGAVIIVNHTVVAGGMPNYLKSLFSDLVGQYGDSIFDRSGRLRLEVLGAIRAMKIIGVSIDHTRILKEAVFPESLRDVGANKEMIAEILSKIVMDNEYGSSNGTHPKHFQAPEAQNLIDKYKTQFGNATMDDNET
jgi:glucan phosphorylase